MIEGKMNLFNGRSSKPLSHLLPYYHVLFLTMVSKGHRQMRSFERWNKNGKKDFRTKPIYFMLSRFVFRTVTILEPVFLSFLPQCLELLLLSLKDPKNWKLLASSTYYDVGR